MTTTTSSNPTGIQVFKNEMFGEIRTMTNHEGETFFVGKDVAQALGYSNSRKALLDHVDEEDKGVTKCDTLGGSQQMTIINESGLYSLILSSQLPQAKVFKRWVTSEVLPQIRRQGGYLSAKAQATPLIDLSGSHGSHASIVVVIGTDGKALTLSPEVVQRLMAGGAVLPALPEYRPYHGPVRALVARTAHGIVREGADDYTLYIRIPSKAYLQALDVTMEEFFGAEFDKLMEQCAMEEE